MPRLRLNIYIRYRKVPCTAGMPYLNLRYRYGTAGTEVQGTSVPLAAVEEGPWPGMIVGDALARAVYRPVKPTGTRQMHLPRILNNSSGGLRLALHRAVRLAQARHRTSSGEEAPPPRRPTEQRSLGPLLLPDHRTLRYFKVCRPPYGT